MNKPAKHMVTVGWCLLTSLLLAARQQAARLYTFPVGEDVQVTIDEPVLHTGRSTMIILYALPNGNNTLQTMGKKMQPGDDWHFDIQHIKAQTAFIRQELSRNDVVVVYLENTYKAWPQWKTRHTDYAARVQHIVDTVFGLFRSANKVLYLNGHSGGGRFIFSYLDGLQQIPAYVKRISFLDSNYGYDSTYKQKLQQWLTSYSDTYLNVFAYNDSVALYNDKPVVSATGGTWYRSHLMLRDLQEISTIRQLRHDSLLVYSSQDRRIGFFLKNNPDRKIYHTQQVELNGFIHSILFGTRRDTRQYRYYTKRAYSAFIE